MRNIIPLKQRSRNEKVRVLTNLYTSSFTESREMLLRAKKWSVDDNCFRESISLLEHTNDVIHTLRHIGSDHQPVV